MKIRKTENHHMLLLPVLLILAAAFLATSLTGAFTSEVDITGYAVSAATPGRCDWVTTMSTNTTSNTALCPSNKPSVISGGCIVVDPILNPSISESDRFYGNVSGTMKEGWSCQSDKPFNVQSIGTSALCCNV